MYLFKTMELIINVKRLICLNYKILNNIKYMTQSIIVNKLVFCLTYICVVLCFKQNSKTNKQLV